MSARDAGALAVPARGASVGRLARITGLALALGAAWAPLATGQDAAPALPGVVLDEATRALAHEFSPLPPPPPDPTNAVADDPAAALLGQALFHDTRLSVDGSVSCATCHKPELGFGDGRALAFGVAEHSRHSMSLWNLAYNRWFFWDGRKDSLWAQATEPLEDPREHATSRLAVLHTVAADARLAAAYERLFGPLPALEDGARFPAEGRPVPDDEAHPHAVAWAGMSADDRLAVDRAYTNLGKAIAAYERRLVSRRAPFDVFVEGLEQGDPDKLAALSPAAQRGFALFVGRGECLFCHDGPNFSDGEFHSNRIPLGSVPDPGRAVGIRRLLADPFNLGSAFSDDGGQAARTRLAVAPRMPHVPGDFKTPSLRNVALSPPYMHDGQFATLEQVLAFYSTLADAAPADPSGEQLIRPRHFSAEEQADLVAFLKALTDDSLPPELVGPPASLEPAPRDG